MKLQCHVRGSFQKILSIATSPGPPTSSVSNLDFGRIHDGGLSTGALVEQVQLKGDRLQYKLLIGEGAHYVNHWSCGGFLVCFFSWGDPHYGW